MKTTVVARPLLMPVAKNYADANMVCSRAERVLILEHHFASNPFAAVREAFSLHSLKFGMWCAVSGRRILGPLNFEKTVNVGRYQNILTQLISQLE
jgi:hypothetical protein